jgi:Predicted integral membrane protein
MGFWIFMLVNNLVLPVLMLVFGRVFQTKPPAEINSFYGYRTRMSSLNQDTWEYAHLYFGKLWLRLGFGMLLLTGISMLSLYGKDHKTVGTAGGAVALVQILLLLLSVGLTERKLREKFDAQGHMR